MGIRRMLSGLRPRSRRLGTSEDVRSHLLVERIENSFLYARGYGPRVVLEATGVNFELKSHFEQLGLLDVMAELLQYLHDPIQILVRSRSYEPDEYFETLEGWRRAWTAKRELREQRLAEYKQKVLELSVQKQIKDRRFYVVLPFTRPPLERLREPSADEVATQLSAKERQVSRILKRGGIRVRRLSSAEVEELFYYAYDPAMARIQKLRSKSALQTTITVAPLAADDFVRLSVRTSDIREMIVPSVLEVTPDHIHSQNREDLYVRVMYIHDYPREVSPNWLKDVLGLDFNLDVSLHVTPLDPRRARTRLDASERELAGTLAAVGEDDAPTARDLQERLEDIAYAKEEFRNKAKWFHVSLYIAPYANTLDGLEHATRAIEDQLAGLFFRSQRAIYRQEQGLNSVLPQGVDLLKQTRGISTRPLAAAFPFNEADQIDAGGYLFGVVGTEHTAKTMLVLNPRTWDNPHMLVLGWSGNGKSANVKEKLLHEWIAGSHVGVIDPRGEYGPLAEHCQGEVIPIFLGSAKTINIWDLAPEAGRNPFSSKVPQLISFWKLALGYLPEEELQLLDGAITAAYQRVGINPGDPETWSQPSPITSDFQQAIWDRYGSEERTRLAATSLCERVQRFSHGYLAPLFNQRTNVNLANDFLVFDVRVVRQEQSDLLPLVYWLVLNHLRTWMTTRLRRRVICIDEFWSLARHAEGMTFVDEIARTARHANTQLVLISQSVAEMLSSPEAVASLSNMATTILHKQHPDHIARVMDTFHLSEAEGRYLQSAERGQCLVVTGAGEHVAMSTIAYDPEHELYCTEPFKCGHAHTHDAAAEPIGAPT